MKNSNRTSYTELPEVKELEAIMKKEAWRNPATGKEAVHYPVFDTVVGWLDSLGVGSEIFRNTTSWQTKLVELNELVPEVVRKTLNYRGGAKLFNSVVDYLGEEDIPQNSDLIFVFGSKSLMRIEKAVKLYKKKLASKIFITGGQPYYEKGSSEAESFKNYAIENGVTETDVLIDPNAITIADNVRGGLNFLDDRKISYSSLILVTNWFAMRRSWAFINKYVSYNCKLYRAVSEVDSDGDFAKDKWFKNETGIKVVFNEYAKMKIGTLLNTC